MSGMAQLQSCLVGMFERVRVWGVLKRKGLGSGSRAEGFRKYKSSLEVGGINAFWG